MHLSPRFEICIGRAKIWPIPRENDTLIPGLEILRKSRDEVKECKSLSAAARLYTGSDFIIF